eukprot:bmy_03947T0
MSGEEGERTFSKIVTLSRASSRGSDANSTELNFSSSSDCSGTKKRAETSYPSIHKKFGDKNKKENCVKEERGRIRSTGQKA